MTNERIGLEAWDVDDSHYPRCGPAPDELRAALAWAILAPSSHNAQPWLFEVQTDAVDVIADRTRGLPVVDPYDRELTISVAAAAATLAVALRRFGHSAPIDWLPDPRDPDVIARVRFGEPHLPSESDLALFAAVTSRRTDRGPFVDEPVPAGLLERLALDAAAEGAHVEFVEGSDRIGVGELVAQADLMQMDDRMFRRELASWTTSNRSHRRDGLRGYGVGVQDLASNFGPMVVRRFDIGRGRAAHDVDLAEGSPALVVIGTPGDEPQDWLAAGAALTAMLLRLTVDGYSASFLNQPIEVEPLREQVSEEFGAHGVAQLLLRVGRPQEPAEHSPRRPLSDVVVAEIRWPHATPT